ncbi:phage holin family protein [Methylobacterium sp. JK268]
MNRPDTAVRAKRDSIVTLVLDAVAQTSDLVTMHLDLLGAELDGIGRSLRLVVSSVGGVVTLLCCGGFLLLMAAVKALAWLTGSEVLGAILVAAPFAAAAVGLAAWGIGKMHAVGHRAR